MEYELIAAVPPLPPRPEDGHKGTFGRVLILGGSEDMIGAPVLAGTAALRMGSGLVQIAVHRTILPAAISITPELIGLCLGKAADEKRLLAAADAADALVVGPGLGQSPEAAARVKRLLSLEKPAVVDADALNLIAAGKKWPKYFRARGVLTPHPGEMARLAKFIGRKEVPRDPDGRIEIAVQASRAFGQVIVLKGHRTVITDGHRVYVNQTGDSTLAKAGSGDVLSGMLGSLLGQGMELFDAAVLATHLHGLSGEIAGRDVGHRCALARDVIDAIPAAIAHFSPMQ